MKQLTKKSSPSCISSSRNSIPEKETTNSQSGRRPEQTFLQRRHTDANKLMKSQGQLASCIFWVSLLDTLPHAFFYCAC